MTNIVFRCRNIVSAFLVLQLSVLSVSGAEKSSARGKELNDAEKLQIIKEIILKNQDDRLDWIDPEKICNEIANEMEPDRIETGRRHTGRSRAPHRQSGDEDSQQRDGGEHSKRHGGSCDIRPPQRRPARRRDGDRAGFGGGF